MIAKEGWKAEVYSDGPHNCLRLKTLDPQANPKKNKEIKNSAEKLYLRKK